MRPCYNCKRFNPNARSSHGSIGGCAGKGQQYDIAWPSDPNQGMFCEIFESKQEVKKDVEK